MTRVVFYLIASDSTRERQAFACRLAEKAYRTGHKVYIHTDSEPQCKTLDDLLWTFRAGSFVPHGILNDTAPTPHQPVVIGCKPTPPEWREIVINLSSACPQELDGAGRILEILDRGEDTRQAGRIRYRRYQQMGFDLETHDMAAQEHA